MGAPRGRFGVCALASAGVDRRAALVEACLAITGAKAITLKPALVMPKPWPSAEPAMRPFFMRLAYPPL